MTVRVGIVGASGYTGGELIRLLSDHPAVDLVHLAAGRAAGEPLEHVWPGLRNDERLAHLTLESYDPERAATLCDVIFLALPHGISANTAPQLVDANCTVVDLGADFRLQDPTQYERYYGASHPCPERLSSAVYGLVEWNREALKGAKLIANPGCYPTVISLAVRPFVASGLVDGAVIADCLSGVSGAGRDATAGTHFCAVSESAKAYKAGGVHRHVPEIQQSIQCPVTFTPHLIPINRGMLATVHFRPKGSVTLEDLQNVLQKRYAGEAMVCVRDTIPATADVRGSNRAHVHVCYDDERNMVTVIGVIDNLLKGASGQAVQAMNVALGLPEAQGLPTLPLVP